MRTIVANFRPFRFVAFAVAALTMTLALAPAQAEAQIATARFEGHWDPKADDPKVVNTYTFAATGRAPRKFGVMHLEGEQSSSPASLWQPQFLPVTNVEGDAATVAKFFDAPAGQKVSVIGVMTAGGQDMILNSVIVWTGKNVAAPK